MSPLNFSPRSILIDILLVALPDPIIKKITATLNLSYLKPIVLSKHFLVIAVIKTFSQLTIHDSLVSYEGFNFLKRNDCIINAGGGTALYEKRGKSKYLLHLIPNMKIRLNTSLEE